MRVICGKGSNVSLGSSRELFSLQSPKMFAQAITNVQRENLPIEESDKSEVDEESSDEDNDDEEGVGRPMSVHDIRRAAAVNMRPSIYAEQRTTLVVQSQADLAHCE